MYQCSICTEGSSFCSLDSSKKCTVCRQYTPHICSRCIIQASGVMPTKCYLCTTREHTCLSKCLGGCILQERPKCKCGHPIRLQVKKQNKNHGRYFWSCRDCNFFEWESSCNLHWFVKHPKEVDHMFGWRLCTSLKSPPGFRRSVGQPVIQVSHSHSKERKKKKRRRHQP